jgi:Cu-processing system ATP-binding protein
MILIKNLHKKFGKLTVLDGLDLEINSGGIFAILGPNGSGKTTLIKSVLGMVIPNSGEIEINGVSILKKWDYRNQINYLPQIANFPNNLSVKELLAMVKNLRPKESHDKDLIEAFGLAPFLEKKLGNLSGGTKQKVNIVLTFMFDSELIILDEPTTGLDPISLIYLKEIIRKEKEKGKTLLITTHIMSLVEEIADEIVFLLDGKIYFKGNLDELKSQTKQSDLEHAIANLISKENV